MQLTLENPDFHYFLRGVSPEGAVRLVAVDCNGESREEPLVTIDGQPQHGVSPKAASELATKLRAKRVEEARV